MIILIAVILAYFVKSRKQRWIVLAVTVAAMIVYVKALPSYLPKGTIKRTALPEFTQSEAQIEDRNSRPVSGEERDRIRKDEYRKGPEFLQK